MLNCYLFRPINSIYNDRNLTAACFSRFNKTISNHKWIGHLGHVQNRCRRISHTKGWCTRCSDQADGYRNLLPLTIVSIPMISRIQYQVNVIQTAVSGCARQKSHLYFSRISGLDTEIQSARIGIELTQILWIVVDFKGHAPSPVLRPGCDLHRIGAIPAARICDNRCNRSGAIVPSIHRRRDRGFGFSSDRHIGINGVACGTDRTVVLNWHVIRGL